MIPTRPTAVHGAILICVAVFGAAPARAAETRCMEEYKAEVTRIGIDAERRAKASPAGPDIEAQQRFMQPIHDAMVAAANRARDCEEGQRRSRDVGKPPPSPGRALTDPPASNASPASTGSDYANCMGRVDQRLDQLRRRTDANGNPDPAEQKARREARQKIVDERAACLRLAR